MVIRKYVMGVSRPELVYDEAAKVVSLEEAVMKMTSLPARRLKLGDRGLVRVGCWADVVVFDPEKITDTATYLNPYMYPTGIEHVLVNAVAVISGGEHTGALPGKPLRLGSGRS
jgi:N-acyl-D-amino-acid deacylase